jgi:hypothetical protein
MAKLNVGDMVIMSRYSRIIHTIDRVTPTQAMSGKLRFQRDYDIIIYPVGHQGFQETYRLHEAAKGEEK